MEADGSGAVRGRRHRFANQGASWHLPSRQIALLALGQGQAVTATLGGIACSNAASYRAAPLLLTAALTRLGHTSAWQNGTGARKPKLQ